MDFLDIKDKTFLITGVNNKKSIAYFVAKDLIKNGAQVLFSVQKEDQKERIIKLFGTESIVYFCDVKDESSMKELGEKLKTNKIELSGFVHSIAFANFTGKDFFDTPVEDYLSADQISSFSLVQLSKYLKDVLKSDASVVAISISNTKAVSYGYLGPIKASLEHNSIYLAKSFSNFSNVRFNTVCAGPLKTSASAGIPGYVDNYLYAEKLTLRKMALKTSEVANAVCFLLSPKSSGINASSIMVDAGMSCNYFDADVVHKVMS